MKGVVNRIVIIKSMRIITKETQKHLRNVEINRKARKTE